MRKIGEIAKEIRLMHKVSQQDLAAFMTENGCPTNRDAIKYAENNSYTDERLLLFCKRFDIDDPVDTFLGEGITSRLNERGQQAWAEAKSLILKHGPYLKSATIDLRLAPGSVSAGPGVAGDPDPEEVWVTVPLEGVPAVQNRDDLMVAKVSGRSMEPELNDGDYIIYSKASPGESPRPGRIIVCYYDYAMMVKIFCTSGREAWLESLNENFQPIPLKYDMAYQGEYLGKTSVLGTNKKLVPIA